MSRKHKVLYMDYTVFIKDRLNGTGNIVIYGTYQPYWINKGNNTRNRKFDIYSDRLLDLKKCKSESILYFQYLLEMEINSGIMVCVVPSCDPQNKNTGIAKVGLGLASAGRKNGVFFLQRHTKIGRLSEGGDRSIEVHLNSIKLMDNADVIGETILLLDDISTTGNSLHACRSILMDNGAKKVEMFALGRTASRKGVRYGNKTSQI